MKRVPYTDAQGRITMVLLPDDVPDNDAYMGVPLGPPALDALGLPESVQTRLHNELFYRGLYNVIDIKRDPQAVASALMAALKVDAETIKSIYVE